jgi:hypothetical protein
MNATRSKSLALQTGLQCTEMLRDRRMAGLVKLRRSTGRQLECLFWAARSPSHPNLFARSAIL